LAKFADLLFPAPKEADLAFRLREMDLRILSDRNNTAIRAAFRPSSDGEKNFAWTRPRGISALLSEARRAGDGLEIKCNGYEMCLICLDKWNTDFVGPTFATTGSHSAGLIRRLTLTVNLYSPRYPVHTTGYIYRACGELLSRLDLRHFGMNLPRSLTFDVSSQDLSSLSKFMIAFQVRGGGSQRIPCPPLISSVSLEIEMQTDSLDAPGAGFNQLGIL